MPARRILIVYATGHGQTAKIARFMADILMAAGDSAMLVDARDLPRGARLPRELTLSDFDGVIVGASVESGHHQRCAARFVRAHLGELNAMPSAFFSVSGAAGDAGEAKRAEARGYIDRFLAETGWRPGRTETVAGAIAYTKYGWFLRWTMRRIAAKEGRPVDTARDHEMTDWSQVRRFAEAFAAATPASHEQHRLATV